MRQDKRLVPVVGTEEQVQRQLEILAEQREELIKASKEEDPTGSRRHADRD